MMSLVVNPCDPTVCIDHIESEGSVGVVTLNQSRKSWAAELGLTHEALYRTLKCMQDDGVLDVSGNRMATKVGGSRTADKLRSAQD